MKYSINIWWDLICNVYSKPHTFNNKFWWTTTDCAMHCVTPSHHCAVHNTVCCDQQVTVVSQLLTKSVNDRHAVDKSFLVHRLEKSSRGNYRIQIHLLLQLQPFYGSLDFVQDFSGEPAPER